MSFLRALVGWHHQSLLGAGGRHCDGIISLIMAEERQLPVESTIALECVLGSSATIHAIEHLSATLSPMPVYHNLPLQLLLGIPKDE